VHFCWFKVLCRQESTTDKTSGVPCLARETYSRYSRVACLVFDSVCPSSNSCVSWYNSRIFTRTFTFTFTCNFNPNIMHLYFSSVSFRLWSRIEDGWLERTRSHKCSTAWNLREDLKYRCGSRQELGKVARESKECKVEGNPLREHIWCDCCTNISLFLPAFPLTEQKTAREWRPKDGG